MGAKATQRREEYLPLPGARFAPSREILFRNRLYNRAFPEILHALHHNGIAFF